MSREQELVWAIEVQTECLQDLKLQLLEKQRLIELQQTLLAIRNIQIEKQTREIHECKMNQNYEWN